MVGSRGIKEIVATVGVLTLASVWQAVPAAAALTSAVYGFGSNQWGELGNGTTTASLSPTPVAWSSARSRPRCLICTATASPRRARP